MKIYLLEKYLEDVEARDIIKDKDFYSNLKRMLTYDIEARISVQELYNWMVISL